MTLRPRLDRFYNAANHNKRTLLMEIKLLCNCGTKFKFDWDVQRDGMPSRVNCPGCAADITLEAREVIKQLSGAVQPAPPPPVQAVPVIAPPPVPVQTPPPAARVATPAPPPVPRAVPARAEKADGEDSSSTKLIVIGVLVVVLGVGGLAAWIIGKKVYAGVEAAREMASILKDAGTAMEFNLQAVDEVILYVNHSNHLEVAQACTEYWKTSLNRNLALVRETGDDEGQPGDRLLSPAYHGYVRITGPLEWQQAHFEGLAKFLSQRFKTLVFEERDVDFSGAYHFGVYENGERKFHAQMDIGKDLEEKVTVENESWALQHGFKPGAEGFKEFNIGDADEITKRLGMKLWDEPEPDEDNPPPQWILREQPASR